MPFEHMLNHRLNFKDVPTSIYKLTAPPTDDDDSATKLKQMVCEILKPQPFNINSTMNNIRNS